MKTRNVKHTHQKRVIGKAKPQHGFGLVELMISVTIGLVVMGGILSLYINTRQTNNEIEKTNRQIENGSLALELLTNDIVHGGFWESYVPDYEDLTLTSTPEYAPLLIPSPCKSYDSWDDDYKTALLGIPLQAYDDSVPDGCEEIVLDKQDGTDVLIVRHAALTTCSPETGSCEKGDLYFQSSLCKGESEYDYLLDTEGFEFHKLDCATLSDARHYVSNLYYIRNYYLTPGDDIPTLMRAEFKQSATGKLGFQPAVAMVEGVEDFRVELGIDYLSATGVDVIDDVDPLNHYDSAITWPDSSVKKSAENRGDGIPDAYVHCPSGGCTLGRLSNVVSAKLYLLVRNENSTTGYSSQKVYTLGDEEVGPFTDSFKRHMYSTSIRLHNIAGRRETPL